MTTVFTHRDIQYECTVTPRKDGRWTWLMAVLRQGETKIQEGTARSEGFALGAAKEAGQKRIDEILRNTTLEE